MMNEERKKQFEFILSFARFAKLYAAFRVMSNDDGFVVYLSDDATRRIIATIAILEFTPFGWDEPTKKQYELSTVGGLKRLSIRSSYLKDNALTAVTLMMNVVTEIDLPF